MMYTSYKLKLLIALMLILGVKNINAQDVNFEWAIGIGSNSSDIGQAVAVDTTGNVYVTGYFQGSANFNPSGGTTLTPAGSLDGFLAKYDTGGNYVWAISIGGSGIVTPCGVAVDAATGNVYVTGYFTGSADFDPGTNTALLTSMGTGSFVLPPDIFLAKYDANGNYIWAKSMGGSGYNYGQAVTVDGAGNIYVTGYCNDSVDFNIGGNGGIITAQSVHAFLAKYDANGNYIWAKNMGDRSQTTQSYGVTVDGTGNAYITGPFNGTAADFNIGGSGGILASMGNYDVFIAKYDPSGNFLWAKNVGGNGNDQGCGIAVDIIGNVHITGYFNSPVADFKSGGSGGMLNRFGSFDIFLAKYDSSGNYLWAKNMGAGGIDQGRGIDVDPTGNIYITGYFNGLADFDPGVDTVNLTHAGNADVFVAKYDPNGNYLWAKSMGGSGADHGLGVAVDDIGNVYATGNFNSLTADFNPGGGGGTLTGVGADDIFVLKLSQGCEIFTILTESVCDSFTFNGVTYSVSGIYVDTFTSFENCDSIVTLNLTITGQASVNPVVTGHYCDSVTFNEATYTSSGTYLQYYSNTLGCDSNITFELTIGQSNSGSVSETGCDSIEFNGTVYTTTGIYLVVLTNEDACDSSVTLDVIINSAEASVIKTGVTLTANSADNYQWFNCDSNTVIPGATGQNYTATQTGNYAVIVTSNECSDTSDCVFMEASNNINELSMGHKVRLYPNPTGSQVMIQTQRVLKNVTIRLVNVIGQTLEERTNQQGNLFIMDMTPYVAGIYFIEISEVGLRLKLLKE